MKTIERKLFVSLPFDQRSIEGAFIAVSEIRGVDIGDGKKYRFVAIRNFKTEKAPESGSVLKRKNEKGETEDMPIKESHYIQSFSIDLEELPI